MAFGCAVTDCLAVSWEGSSYLVQTPARRPEPSWDPRHRSGHLSRIGYIHLKTSSKDRKPQSVAGDSELDHEIVFAIAAKAKMPDIGFELPQPDTLEQA